MKNKIKDIGSRKWRLLMAMAVATLGCRSLVHRRCFAHWQPTQKKKT